MIQSTVLGLCVLLAAAIVLSGFLVIELLRRRKTYYRRAIEYDIKNDDVMHFDSKRSRSMQLEWATHDDLKWSIPQGKWSAAFIEIDVAATRRGEFIDPSLETRLGERVVRHYFERGARGKRFINVSAHVQQHQGHEELLHLNWRHLRCASRELRLHLTSELPIPNGPLLVLAPHPDDAEIAAFGLISQHPDAWVVTITLGDNGPNHYGRFFNNERDSYLEKSRVRAWDSVTIPQLAGVPAERIANLGYFDGTLALMKSDPDRTIAAIHTGETQIGKFRKYPLETGSVSRPSTWRNLVADFEELLRHIKPTAVVTPHPQLDLHGDHQGTTFAVLEALQKVGLSDGVLLLYSNHAIGTELYPFGPKDGAISLPPMKGPAAAPLFDSILSVPLDQTTRLRKQLGIEAQHDLLPSPPAAPLGLWKTIRKGVALPYSFIVQPDISYVRRAARPNELFFALPFADAQALRLAGESTHASRE